jgi:hypothetical protein
VIGRLNMYVEPGTIMGPTMNKEMVTALDHICSATDDGPECFTTFRHTQTKDFSAVPVSGPRSVTEHAMMQVQRSIFGPVRSTEIINDGKVHEGEILPAKLTYGRGRNGRP